MPTIQIQELNGTPQVPILPGLRGMQWDLLRSVLQGVIQSIADTGIQVLWIDQSRPYVDPNIRALILLDTITTSTQGRDDKIQEQDLSQPQGLELQDRFNSIRNFTLSIRCESYEQNNSKVAIQYLENIRSRLYFRGVREKLNVNRLAFYHSENIVDLSETRDNRRTAIAVLDLKMRAHVSERDPSRYGYVTRVGISNT